MDHSIIQKSIEVFKKESNWKEDLKYPVDKEVIQKAVDFAYNDAKRTMTNISSNVRDSAKGAVVDEIKKYFDCDPPKSEAEFDILHKKMCEAWRKEFNTDNLKAYGKAQKIVNMSFKYLYCCSDERTGNYFQFCHMPLDSYILEWFKRNIKEYPENNKVIKGKIRSWSKLQYQNDDYYYGYKFYVDAIRWYYKDKTDCTPLQLEFIIWPEIQRKLAAEQFLFLFKEDITKDEKKRIIKDCLEDNISEIQRIVKE